MPALAISHRQSPPPAKFPLPKNLTATAPPFPLALSGHIHKRATLAVRAGAVKIILPRTALARVERHGKPPFRR